MSRDGTTILALFLPVLLVITPGAASGRKLVPEGHPASAFVRVSENVYKYFALTIQEPLVLTVEGPAVFEAITRWRFVESMSPVNIELEFTVDGAETWRHVLKAYPGNARYPAEPGAVAGRAKRISFDLPSGEHTVEMRLIAPAGGVLDVNPLAELPAVMPWRIEWRAELGASYDSNIFRYSDEDVDDYLDGLREDRFPLDAVDDLRLEPSVRMAFVREEPGVRVSEIRLGADWRLASVNGEKSFSKLAVRISETRPRVARLTAEYSAIPEYRIRDLWDPDADGGSSGYRSCDFQKHAVRLEVASERSLPVDLAGIWKYEVYWYDPDFVEYDSAAWTAGARATVRPRPGLRLDFGYALRRSTARGYDEIGETRATSDDSDTTYDQDEYVIRARHEAGEWWGLPAVLTIRGRYARRYYQTAKSGEDDPYHTGREDAYWVLRAGVRLELTDTTGLEGFVEHRGRSVASEWVPDIGDVKDYAANRFGVRFTVEGVRFLDRAYN